MYENSIVLSNTTNNSSSSAGGSKKSESVHVPIVEMLYTIGDLTTATVSGGFTMYGYDVAEEGNPINGSITPNGTEYQGLTISFIGLFVLVPFSALGVFFSTPTNSIWYENANRRYRILR